VKELNERIRALQDDVDFFAKNSGAQEQSKKLSELRADAERRDRE
jgi:hypothetical protein